MNKDRILSYLPETVHVSLGYEIEPSYFGGPSDVDYFVVEIPKKWLQHNKRGTFYEWTIKSKYQSKFDELEKTHIYGHKHTEPIQVLEWNQLENIAYNLRKAKQIGFDNILEIVNEVNNEDIIYTHSVGI